MPLLGPDRMSAPILVAPDSFKGTLAAAAVAGAIAAGLREGGADALELPVADGGDGTLDVVAAALDVELRSAAVTDPLGRTVDAEFALLGDGSTALVEMARASGLTLVAPADRDAFAATSRGTGELIAAAVEAGAQRVVVTVGGSATTDGGAGALAALEDAGVSPRLEVLYDTRTAWEDCARVFAPQKGADAATVARLQRRLGDLARRAPKDPRGVLGGGAAGGLAGGLWAHRGAKLTPGAAWVLDELGFDAAMRACAFAICGEGRLDRQTLAGKAAGEVATRCRQSGVGCHAVVGSSALDRFEERILDLQTVTEAGDERALRDAGRELARLAPVG